MHSVENKTNKKIYEKIYKGLKETLFLRTYSKKDIFTLRTVILD